MFRISEWVTVQLMNLNVYPGPSVMPDPQIKNMLNEGWQPWGHPFVVFSDVYQVFVKYEEDDE